jgi:hypothetical protein
MNGVFYWVIEQPLLIPELPPFTLFFDALPSFKHWAIWEIKFKDAGSVIAKINHA